MARTPSRLAIIGLDCALPHLIKQYIAEGHLPTFKKLIQGGVIAENCLVPSPMGTSSHWATVATGAWAGTHRIADFPVHRPETMPASPDTGRAASGEYCHAEPLWDTLDKAGQKCIVLNYPGAWPSRMQNGIMVGGGDFPEVENRDGRLGLDTSVAASEQYIAWLADAATTLLAKHEWDAFFVHCHLPDWLYDNLISEMDPVIYPDESFGERRQKAREAHLKICQCQDDLIARILETCGRDAFVILVSDRGATPDGRVFHPYRALVPAGLTVIREQPAGGGPRPGESHLVVGNGSRLPESDPRRSQAMPQRGVHIYVNLKGRDPEGIVEPKGYEKVQQEIIDALYRYADPATGRRPVALALTKKDARVLNLYGDGIGDVVYAVYPWFGGQHGEVLPTGEWGIGSVKGLLVMNGPGLKKGYRLQRTVWMTDLVPTICYLMNLPVPAQAEGAVLYQAFKNPDFKRQEIQKLREGLARMELALDLRDREPWDRHGKTGD